MNARVVAVAASGEHTFSKQLRGSINLLARLGVEGDAHCGALVKHRYLVKKNPHAPNLAQVHLLPSELFAELGDRGLAVAAGEMGENITTTGLDLLALPVGACVHLGAEAVVEITGLRTPCVQMNGLRPGLMQACLARGPQGETVRKAGVMAIVRAGGVVRGGDSIDVTLPPGPHRPLRPV